MRIKPKNPKYLKVRRVVVAGAAALAVLTVLLSGRERGPSPEDEITYFEFPFDDFLAVVSGYYMF